MIVCPHCNHHNPERAQRCEACQGSLEGFVYRACPSCGALNLADNLCCQRCFEPLDETLKELLAGIETPITPFVPPQPTDLVRPAESQEEEPTSLHLARTRAAGRVEHNENEGSEGESIDPLAGIEDAIPIEPTFLRPRRSPLRPRYEPSEGERREAALFRQLATERATLAEPGRVVVPRQPKVLHGFGRAVLYVMVLLAALVPFISPGHTTRWVRPRPAVYALASGVENLQPGLPVLISIDYSPPYAGEMDALALTLVKQLSRNSVPMLVMSTSPTGLGMARSLFLEGGEPLPLAYGEDLLLLGYVPSQEAGLRSLLVGFQEAFPQDAVEHRSLEGFPAMAGAHTLDDLDHVFILTDDATTMRRWVEQVGVHSSVHLHALATSRVEPLLVPYREAGQIVTLVGGAPAIAEYEYATGETGRFPGRYSDGLVALALVIIGVAIAANVGEWRQRTASRREVS